MNAFPRLHQSLVKSSTLTFFYRKRKKKKKKKQRKAERTVERDFIEIRNKVLNK